MKKNLTLILWGIFVLALIISCKKDDPEIIDKALDGAHAAAVTKSTVIDYKDNNLTGEITLLIVDERGNFVSGLSNDNFTLVENYYLDETSINEIKREGMTSSGPYSASLLLDQSGSIVDTDPDDLRIEASKIFIRFLGDDDEVSLTSFQRGGYDILYNFTSDSLELFPLLDELIDNEGGGTPLYETAYEMISYTVDSASNSNKCIIAFTDGRDTGWSPGMMDVIEKAQQNNVKVFTIGLSNNIEFEYMGYLANETDGAFMWAKDVKQLVSIFGNLGELLHGSATLYKVIYSAKTPNVLSPNYIYNNELKIKMEGDTIIVPFTINTGTNTLKSENLTRDWDMDK